MKNLYKITLLDSTEAHILDILNEESWQGFTITCTATLTTAVTDATAGLTPAEVREALAMSAAAITHKAPKKGWHVTESWISAEGSKSVLRVNLSPAELPVSIGKKSPKEARAAIDEAVRQVFPNGEPSCRCFGAAADILAFDKDIAVLRRGYNELNRLLMHSGWHLISACINMLTESEAVPEFHATAIWQPEPEEEKV